MGRKTDPKSVDLIKSLVGMFGWIGCLLGGSLLWIEPQPLPNYYGTLPLVVVLAQLVLLWLFSHFILRDRNGQMNWGGVLLFVGTGFLGSVLGGLLDKPANVVFYLVPVLWVAAGLRIAKAFWVGVLAMLPETLQWINIHQVVFSPVPVLPGAADPLLFDWNLFFSKYYGLIWIVPLLAMVISRLKTIRIASSLRTPSVATSAGMSAPTPSLIPPGGGTGGTVQVPNMDANMVQNAQQNAELSGILESIVYFMSKNFKSYSALGLLSLDEGHTFVINAKFSKSNFMRDNVLIYPSSGIVGKAITEPNGFMSGNVKTYPDKVEYYSKLEEVNSIIVSRIVDEESRKVMGLLVVDSPNIRAFEDSDKELLNRFSVVASKLISNARMRKVLEFTAHQSEVVYQISKLLAAENYTRGVIGVLIENLRKVFDADRLIVCDFSSEHGQGRILKLAGDSGDVREGMLFQVDDPYCLYGMAFINKIEYLETEVLRENRYRFRKDEEPEFSPAEVMVAPLLDDHGNTIAVIGLETNTSGTFQKRSIVLLQTIMANASSALTRAQMYTKLEKQATIDGLTKIPNHRHFQETLDKVIARCTQAKRPFGLLLMDIDHFKIFNDTYGHPIGDKVLQLVASTVAKTIRPNDFVARYGGEEFTVIIDTEPSLLLQAAERVREAIEAQSFEHEGNVCKVTVSIGAACFPLDSMLKKDLIDMADQAMYRSKESGRNRVTLWSQVTK